jgi:N6-adenosine-specific RNA methylase IME4
MATTAMHIQWKQYKAKDGSISIRLYIRSSHRENGKVKSSVHGYLGSYRLDRISTPAEARKLWAQIDAAFERIDDPAVPGEREKLEAEIAAKIQRPTVPKKPPRYTQGDKRGQLKESISTVGLPPIPQRNYSLIVIDPPWSYELRESDKTHRNRTTYPTMLDEQILALPIGEIAAQQAYCLLWVTNNHLPLGFRCLEFWGFEYKSIFTWVKVTKDSRTPHMGTGHYGRNCTEHFLVGARGKVKSFTSLGLTKTKNVIYAPRTDHSRKPEEFFVFANLLGDALSGQRIELFARKRREGWDSWGAEVEIAI